MKRRQAIKNIVLLTSAAALLPGCQPAADSMPAYANIPLDKKQWKLLEQFTVALLPKAKTGVATPESPTDFILTVLNDCTSPEDIQKYIGGLTELQAHIAKQYKTDFGSLAAAQQAEVFTLLSTKEGASEPMLFFYEKTRGLAIEHFTSSEFFMKNVTKWEFAPGYFKGCVAV
jgi:Gluconate 2-dehydrogenase subunit 3